MFIVISGLSGAGKTTLGRVLAAKLGLPFMDIDDFYRPLKPMVTLSNGMRVKNWDSLEALDIPRAREAILHYLNSTGLVLVGFALRDDVLPVIPDMHIHLITGSTKEEVIEKCILARRQSKSPRDFQRDALMVNEVVYPFYMDTLAHSTIDLIVTVFDEYNRRKTIDVLIQECGF